MHVVPSWDYGTPAATAGRIGGVGTANRPVLRSLSTG